MIPLASAGYHVVAYDQRGYGRTTGWDMRSHAEVDMRSFSMSGLVADALKLVNALGYETVECVVGHDFGAVTSAFCGLMRGDVFKRQVLLYRFVVHYKTAEAELTFPSNS
jgi:pimeloyl-ACP methyl ester carboxylesterase